MRILVVGGTGMVGRFVVAELADRGHSVAVLSRRGGTPDQRAEGFAGDAATGEGVAAAVRDVEGLIDCAHVLTTNRAAAVRYFTTATSQLGRLAADAGVGHYVVLSIVGIDGVPFGYYQGKLAQEATALTGQVPATILRATQFHEFAGQNLRRFRFGPLAFMPAMRCQPIAAAEVAVALADLVDKPAGRVPDIGGPRVEWLPDLARALVRRDRGRVAVLTLPVPGAAGRAMRRGALLLGENGVPRGPSFADWLVAEPR
jgi:uncharacterized protein YbjT (DUF2867 family)